MEGLNGAKKKLHNEKLDHFFNFTFMDPCIVI